MHPPPKIQTALYYDVVFFPEFHTEQYVCSVTLRFQSVPQKPQRARSEHSGVSTSDQVPSLIMSFNRDSVFTLKLFGRVSTILLWVVLPTFRKYKTWSSPRP